MNVKTDIKTYFSTAIECKVTLYRPDGLITGMVIPETINQDELVDNGLVGSLLF